MSILLVKSSEGSIRRFELSKNQPLTIGSHSISDIQIDEPGIALMEARVSWAKKQFELSAASENELNVNGTQLTSTYLTSGDRVRIGQTELLFITPEDLKSAGDDPFLTNDDPPASSDTSHIELAPISEELPAWEVQARSPLSPKPPLTRGKAATTPKASTEKTKPDSPSQPDPPTQDRQKDRSSSVPPISRDDGKDDVEEQEEPLHKTRLTRSSSDRSPTKDEASSAGKIREALHSSRQRPGEKELFRSPLVMGLTLGSVFLVISSIVLWSLIDLEEADRYLERARTQADQRKFQQAIEDYQHFLLQFPHDNDNDTAYRELSITRVRSQLDIGVPDWSAGLKELEDLIGRHRDEQGFEEMHGEISNYASQTAIATCEQAAETRNVELFQVSEQALRLVDLYTVSQDRLEQIRSEVKAARRQAEATILRKNVFEEALAQMEQALASSQPADMLATRRTLIHRYAEARTDPNVSALLNRALQLEQSLATSSDEQINALEPALPQDSQLLTLTARRRESNDELPSHRAVIVQAADCLYGIDSATGDPLWRQPFGWELPFFPMEVSLGEPSLLCYSPRKKQLQFLVRESGKIVWSQACPHEIAGRPFIQGNLAYLTTRDGILLKLDLATGTILSQISIAQGFSTSPVFLSDQKHLLGVGERDVLYLFNTNPLKIEKVFYLGHGPGTITAPPLRMGPFLLLAENDQSDQCRLRLLDTRDDVKILPDVERLPGNVIDAPVIRGKDLFIPTTPERITAFTVSAEDETPPLTKVGSHQVVAPQYTSSWMTTGPDGEVWLASTALRRLKLLTETLEASTELAAMGLATQPLQMLGERLYMARRPHYAPAIRFSRFDRATFEGAWRTTLGDRFLHLSVNPAGELITVQDSGEVFRIRSFGSSHTGFELSPFTSVDIPETLTSKRYFHQFREGRAGFAWGGETPRLVTLRNTGQIEKSVSLSAAPVTRPVDLDAGVVIGLPGRLQLISKNGDSTEDFLLPVVEGKQAHWISLSRLDATHLLALDDTHTLRRIEYRTEPLKHLALAGEVTFENPIALTPEVTAAGRVIVISTDGVLHVLSPNSLQQVSARELEAVPSHDPWITDKAIFLQMTDKTFHCLTDDDQLTEQWRLDLKEASVTGTPLYIDPLNIDGEWVVPVGAAGVWRVDAQTGKIIEKFEAPGTCAGDPVLFNLSIVVPLADGTLFFLPEFSLQGEQP